VDPIIRKNSGPVTVLRYRIPYIDIGGIAYSRLHVTTNGDIFHANRAGPKQKVKILTFREINQQQLTYTSILRNHIELRNY